MTNDDDYGDLQQPGPAYADAQNPPSEYANKGSKTPAKPKAPAGKAPGPTGEVTILARKSAACNCRATYFATRH